MVWVLFRLKKRGGLCNLSPTPRRLSHHADYDKLFNYMDTNSRLRRVENCSFFEKKTFEIDLINFNASILEKLRKPIKSNVLVK